VVHGIASMSDLKKVGRIGVKFLIAKLKLHDSAPACAQN
jgi:Na+/H+-dicarboxylate symporter